MVLEQSEQRNAARSLETDPQARDGLVDGDEEIEVLARLARVRGVAPGADTDYLSILVQERAARIPAVDLHVALDELFPSLSR